jgi:hypothetical protein
MKEMSSIKQLTVEVDAGKFVPDNCRLPGLASRSRAERVSGPSRGAATKTMIRDLQSPIDSTAPASHHHHDSIRHFANTNIASPLHDMLL